ncbi:acyl-CoA dehydrogenase family protein [Amycolatopsis aidingensis]|uniref:acyl-CoA dehydrogenase family protein n=1 Tax=Amycolatopsis aidingensis TaxID=2842453 RepID=UPI001C0C36B6|nr:acyl-CoA dehydrogenase family protein [Amycolatopsis aidingensis]
MDLTLTPEQRQISSAAAELLAARRDEAAAGAVRERHAGHSEQLWKELVELDWPALALPAAHGGLGSGLTELCLLLEELGRQQIPSPLQATVACAALPIAEHGDQPQRARWLGAVADGLILGYARAAPHGHWDTPGSTITVRQTPTGLRLDGTAEFVPYAGSASALLVIAQHPGAGPLSAVLVDTATPGVRTERLEVVGTAPEYRVTFTDVPVPGDRRIGRSDGGAAVARTAEAFGATASCAEMVGGAQGALELTVRHATTRRQWDRPIGAFQAVQQHCAEMAADVLGARLIAHEAAWRLAEAGQAATDVPEIPIEIAVAKAYVSEAYQRVCALAHQVHGAIGFTAEHDLHQYTRHAMAMSVAFGDSYHHTAAVATALGL